MEQRKKTTKRICFEQGAEERNRALETNKKFKCIKKSEHISRIFCFFCLDVFSSFMVSILLVAFFDLCCTLFCSQVLYLPLTWLFRRQKPVASTTALLQTKQRITVTYILYCNICKPVTSPAKWLHLKYLQLLFYILGFYFCRQTFNFWVLIWRHRPELLQLKDGYNYISK